MTKVCLNILLFLVALVVIHPAQALKWGDGAGGATWNYYNAAAQLPWQRSLGDWIDKNAKPWGEDPYSRIRLEQNQGSEVELDVTALVQEWLDDKRPNNGFFLRHLGGGGYAIKFHSRENGEIGRSPVLILKGTDNKENFVTASADTNLDKTTYASLGTNKLLHLSIKTPVLIWFDLSYFSPKFTIAKATLKLSVAKTYGSSFSDIGVYAVDPAPNNSVTQELTLGLADNYSFDVGISQHPDVWYASAFETDEWSKPWSGQQVGEQIVGLKELRNRFSPFSGNALAVTLKKGANLAMNQRFKFGRQKMKEPIEAYFRYYLRLGDNWNQTVDGGKLPGFAGTYGKAGWGGRKPDGFNGWSARGRFHKTVPVESDNPLRGLNPIGSYAGHVDQKGPYEPGWIWNLGDGGLLEKNRWYSVEQYIYLNTPGKNDGEMKAWIDGRKVFEKKGLRFRDTDKLRIEEVWFNVYHGGRAKSPQDQTLYIDNLVISGKYIGPVGTAREN